MPAPTPQQFGSFVAPYILGRNVRPVEAFGAVAVGYSDAPIDNRAAIQAAIDWSAATGGTILLGAGVYGHAGTLRIKSHMTMTGRGGRTQATILRQMDTLWPDCLASEVSTSSTTGASHVTVSGFCIDGGWDLKNAAGAGSNWDFLLASKTQHGLYLDSPDAGAGSLNRSNSPDTYNFISDICALNVAGKGFYFGGRGEMIITGCRASACATMGCHLDSPDNWITDCTFNVLGDRGLVVTAGNQRISGVKSWFIGMCKGQEVTGIGNHFEGAGLRNIDAVNLTTQDTWGPGALLEGARLTFHGRIDEAGGGRLQQQGFGYAGGRTLHRHALQIGNLKNSVVQMGIEGSDRDLWTDGSADAPYLVYITASGADMNRISVAYDKHATPPFWYHPTTPAYQDISVTNARRWNIVEGPMGEVLLGGLTAAQIGAANHSCNVYKRPGQQVIDTTNNRVLITMGSAATDPWRTLDGTSVITPA